MRIIHINSSSGEPYQFILRVNHFNSFILKVDHINSFTGRKGYPFILDLQVYVSFFSSFRQGCEKFRSDTSIEWIISIHPQGGCKRCAECSPAWIKCCVKYDSQHADSIVFAGSWPCACVAKVWKVEFLQQHGKHRDASLWNLCLVKDLNEACFWPGCQWRLSSCAQLTALHGMHETRRLLSKESARVCHEVYCQPHRYDYQDPRSTEHMCSLDCGFTKEMKEWPGCWQRVG